MKENRELIPYHKPYPFNRIDEENIILRLRGVFRTGMLSNKYYCKQLEEKIKQLYNVKHVISCSSCSIGLMIAWKSFCERADVNMPSFTWISDKMIIDIMHFTPYYKDIDKNTWLIKENPNKRGVVSMPTHTFGSISDYKCWSDNIYDGSHCLGTEIKDFGSATVISLAPTKLITSCEGGLILTNDNLIAKDCIELRDKLSRMSEINAIIGLQTLKHLEAILSWKKETYEYYKNNIPGQFQEIPISSNYNTIGFLNTKNLKIPEWIEWKQYYEPLKKGLKNTDYVYKNIICLPSWYNCPREQIVKDILKYTEEYKENESI